MRRPSIPPFDTYREYFTKNWLEWFDSLDNEIKQTRLLLKSYIAHATSGASAHNDLTGIQGGTTNEYYHLTSADHTEAVAFLNGGSATHTQLDNERTSSIAHRADSLIHYPQEDIDHTAINNIGIYTHNELDTEKDLSVLHRADTEIHKVEIDEIESTYVDGLEYETIYSLANTPVKTLSYTYDSSSRVETISNGVDTWTIEYYGTGEFKRTVKT